MRFKKEWDGRADAPRFNIDPNFLRDLTIVADYLDI
jgi:hypothetical protein